MPFQPKGTVSKNPASRICKPAFFLSQKKRSSSDTKKKALQEAVEEREDEILKDLGLESLKTLRAKLVPDLGSNDVLALLQYIPQHMFSSIPERAAGMNSTRIAEILNYRIRLPPIVSVAHLHALRENATSTEREIASLIQQNLARKISIPGRGKGSAAIGDCLVLVSEWEKAVEASSLLASPVKAKYIAHLTGQETDAFTPSEYKLLIQQGLMTGSSLMPSVSDTYLQPAKSSLGSINHIADAGAKHAAGSDAAAATSATQHIHAGKTSVQSERYSQSSYRLSLPNVGPFLRLLPEAREHLVHLLAKSGAHKSLSMHRLRELWNGNLIDFDMPIKERKGVLPGQMKKWRQFHGLTFEYVLAECLGAGLVECFRTGGIGTGVRII